MNITELLLYIPVPMFHYPHNYTMPLPLNPTHGSNESCDTYVDSFPDWASSTPSKIAFGFIYFCTFLFGIVGNASMLYVTLCNRAMITVQNIFIMSLAISDIMICIISVPITPIFLIYKEWYFGKLLCHLIVWVQGASVFITTYTLMAIALDRFVLINYPHKQPLTIRSSLHITALIWVSGGAIVFPYAYFMEIVTYPGVCGEFCDEHWPSENFQEAFTVTILVFQYVVPFVVIAFCYWAVLRRLKCHIRVKMDRASCKRLEKIALTRRKRRSTIVLACMVLVFGVCWLPQNAISMIGNYARTLFAEDAVYFAYLAGHSIAMQSILANPILYAWLNSAFRKVIFGIFTSSRHRVSTFFLGQRVTVTTSPSGRRLTAPTANIHPELCTDYMLRRRQSSFPSVRGDDLTPRHTTAGSENEQSPRLIDRKNFLTVCIPPAYCTRNGTPLIQLSIQEEDDVCQDEKSALHSFYAAEQTAL